MSLDLFLGVTKKNWARGGSEAILPTLKSVVATPSRLSPPLTAAEKKRVGEITVVRTRAESGDPAARKEWRKISTAVVGLRVRARGGDPRAMRACQVLEETGLFGRAQKVTVSGAGRGGLLASTAAAQLRSRQAATPPQYQAPDDTSGSEVERLLGEFVGDEARTAREAGEAEQEACARVQGAYSLLGGWGGRRGRGQRRLRRLEERSARGDVNATAKLQRVTARLTQRAQAGDPRAAALLQQVQSQTVQSQTAQSQTAQQALASQPQFSINPATGTPYASPYSQPAVVPGTPYASPYSQPVPGPGVPATGPGAPWSPPPVTQAVAQLTAQPLASVNYPAPQYSDDDSFGAEKRNTGEVDDY